MNNLKSNIKIDFEDEKIAKLIYDAVSVEFNTAIGYRSQMTLNLKDSYLIIDITAKDSTSFRASINSAIKWIRLSYEVLKLNSN